jgi:hypothetical protein
MGISTRTAKELAVHPIVYQKTKISTSILSPAQRRNDHPRELAEFIRTPERNDVRIHYSEDERSPWLQIC